MTREYDVLVRAGRLICPASGVDSPATVLIDAGRIVNISTSASDEPNAKQEFDFPDGIVLPGLIDLHAHPANAGSVFGVSPDAHMLPRGVTTVLSQGDAGADTVDEYVETTINGSRTRILLAINLSRVGESTTQGCLENLDDADIDACVAATQRHRKHIPAIAVNVSNHCCGSTDPREVLSRGIEVSRQTGLPLLFGMRRPEDWPLAEQLALLRAGDIVTYCFRREPHCIVEGDCVLPCVLEARERGVLFDVGHGSASFSLNVAEAAISDGFVPDTISTDIHKNSIMLPRAHLNNVMSKFLNIGLSFEQVIERVTVNPAKAIRRADLGRLDEGGIADIAVLKIEEGEFAFLDSGHGKLTADKNIRCMMTIRKGGIIWDAEGISMPDWSTAGPYSNFR